jgi:hypothetical protein
MRRSGNIDALSSVVQHDTTFQLVLYRVMQLIASSVAMLLRPLLSSDLVVVSSENGAAAVGGPCGTRPPI